MITSPVALRFEPGESLGRGNGKGFPVVKYCLLITAHCAAQTEPAQLGENHDKFSHGSDRDRLFSGAE
jgi:hypothetical protein